MNFVQEQLKTEVNARTERSQNSSHEPTFFLLRKPVESQYSSSSRKKTHVYNCFELRSRAIKKMSLKNYLQHLGSIKPTKHRSESSTVLEPILINPTNVQKLKFLSSLQVINLIYFCVIDLN